MRATFFKKLRGTTDSRSAPKSPEVPLSFGGAESRPVPAFEKPRSTTDSRPVLAFRRTGKGERGASILLFTLMTWLVVVPMVGLAIDGAIVFFAQQRLSAAADAAALAGGRSFTASATLDSQKIALEQTVKRYFDANFPPGFLGTKNMPTPVTTINESDTKVRTVKVTVSGDVALHFMPVLGYGLSHISAVAQTSRRSMNIVMVLDRSGSMGASACAQMKTSAQNFSDSFVDGSDALGVVTFVGSAKADFPASKSFKTGSPTLRNTLTNVGCSGSTNSTEALMTAWTQVKVNSQPGSLDVILFFTDGYPHGFTGAFRFKDGNACQSVAIGSVGYVAPDPTKYDDNGKFVHAVETSKSGLWKDVPVAITGGDPTTLPVTGCATTNLADVVANFDGYPLRDWYGWPTDKYSTAVVYDGGPFTVNRTYNGPKTRLALTNNTVARDNAWLASKSTAYYAASAIRASGVRVYTIGLQSNGGVDGNFLRQMANDPGSDEFDPSAPQGKYAAAADPGQIASAFNSIKSELLRLSQ